jgi:WD40 repeat protein
MAQRVKVLWMDAASFPHRIYRLDTADLTTNYLGYGPVSPDGSMLALWADDNALIIYTVSGDLLARITNYGKNPIPSTIAWSPDSRSLVYVLTEDYCPEGASTLIRLDLPDLEPMVLREYDPGYANVRWLSADRLELNNITGDSSLTVDAADGTTP